MTKWIWILWYIIENWEVLWKYISFILDSKLHKTSLESYRDINQEFSDLEYNFFFKKMKKNTLIAGLILSCILILSHAQTCCETKDYIRITGLGENRVKPDIAILYASLIS